MEIIRLDNVSYAYNRGQDDETQAVKNVSLSIEEGEFVAVLGHNGSGKSTLARLMNGLLEPDEGTVTVAGMSTADNKSLFDIRRTVGVVFQNPDNQMIATIIEDDVAFGPENAGFPSDEIRRRVDWALKSVGMYEYREGTPFRLSGGQKQRVSIAGVLALRPKVMVLDESTSMLDPEGREEVLSVVEKLNREEKMAVVMITHFPEEALRANRIIVMNGGEKIMDGGREIFARAEELRAVSLEVPLGARMAGLLRERGVPVPENVCSLDELTEFLCR